MTNDFSLLDAQTDIGSLALMSPEETAEADTYLAEVEQGQEEITPEGYCLSVRSWNMLEEIHQEIAPVMAQMHVKDTLLSFDTLPSF